MENGIEQCPLKVDVAVESDVTSDSDSASRTSSHAAETGDLLNILFKMIPASVASERAYSGPVGFIPDAAQVWAPRVLDELSSAYAARNEILTRSLETAACYGRTPGATLELDMVHFDPQMPSGLATAFVASTTKGLIPKFYSGLLSEPISLARAPLHRIPISSRQPRPSDQQLMTMAGGGSHDAAIRAATQLLGREEGVKRLATMFRDGLVAPSVVAAMLKAAIDYHEKVSKFAGVKDAACVLLKGASTSVAASIKSIGQAEIPNWAQKVGYTVDEAIIKVKNARLLQMGVQE